MNFLTQRVIQQNGGYIDGKGNCRAKATNQGDDKKKVTGIENN